MKNLFALIVLLCSSASFAVTGYTMPYNFTAGDTVKASKIMANYNSGKDWSLATTDTLEKKFVRFTDTKDTTFDTLKAVRVRATTALVSSGSLSVTGLSSLDSISATKGVSGTYGRFSGPLSGTTITASSTATVDSLKSTKGISATTGTFSGALSGTTITASSTATVDSLKSSKGISATTGTFSGAISATAITGTGTAKVDSIASTKGVSGTYGRFSGPLSGTTITASSTATVDSLKSSKGATFDGKVGIGGTPTEQLDVIGTTGITIAQVRSTSTTGHPGFRVANNLDNQLNLYSFGSEATGYLFASTGTARANNQYLQSYQNLAIGTPYAYDIIFGTSDAERMRIASDGALQKPEQTTTPTAPTSGAACNLYMKADKFIIQYNDGGTVRWKYLDLAGTGVTWVHTTTAP